MPAAEPYRVCLSVCLSENMHKFLESVCCWLAHLKPGSECSWNNRSLHAQADALIGQLHSTSGRVEISQLCSQLCSWSSGCRLAGWHGISQCALIHEAAQPQALGTTWRHACAIPRTLAIPSPGPVQFLGSGFLTSLQLPVAMRTTVL